jgi:S-layer homology domain
MKPARKTLAPFAGALLAAPLLLAQAPPGLDLASAQAYGPGFQAFHVGAIEFVPEFYEDGYRYATLGQGNGYLTRPPFTGDGGHFFAPLRLPTGAEIVTLCLYAKDTEPSDEAVRVQLQAVKLVPAGLPDGVVNIGPLVQTGWDNGLGIVCGQFDPPYTFHEEGDIDGDGIYDWVAHRLYATVVDDNQGALGGVKVVWRRLVSPPPAAASFGDVPTGHAFFQFIEALAASGITGGCGGGNYCPDAPLTRGQMAVFLSKALGLHWPY